MSANDFLFGGMRPFGFFPFGLVSDFGSLLFVAGFVLLAIWAVRSFSAPRTFVSTPGAPPLGTPLDILARRFAGGEITADEYIKARDLLSGPPPPKP